MSESEARQEIEYLRRWYAVATDRIGENTPESIEEGRSIYRRIFTEDCEIRVTDRGKVSLSARGPEEWVAVVNRALGETYARTQHLIGTQIVELHALPEGETGGEASMSSYLQAWQVTSAGVLHRVMGTYRDKVRYTPHVGWQIYEMTLENTTRDVQQLEAGEPPR